MIDLRSALRAYDARNDGGEGAKAFATYMKKRNSMIPTKAKVIRFSMRRAKKARQKVQPSRMTR